MAVRQLSRDPLPANLKEAWENRLADYRKICTRLGVEPDLECEASLRVAFYAGAMAAVHQLNVGRYLEVATFLNSILFKGHGLSDNEIIDTTDALMDGTYPQPLGYPSATLWMPKPE
jgi:hypothetical protein